LEYIAPPVNLGDYISNLGANGSGDKEYLSFFAPNFFNNYFSSGFTFASLL
jgi:hypothetical protein